MMDPHSDNLLVFVDLKIVEPEQPFPSADM